MYGQNIPAKRRTESDGFLVHSMFLTIQGEGPLSGSPALFVRFTGCNLRCGFCDTDFEAGKRYSAEELDSEIARQLPLGIPYRIVLTGGEPMLQPLPSLLQLLYNRGLKWQVDIETAGTAWPTGMENVAYGVNIICSPKTPKVLPEVEKNTTAWKYVIRNGHVNVFDGLPAGNPQFVAPSIFGRASASTVDVFRPSTAVAKERIFVQPCDEGNAECNKGNMEAAIESSMLFGYRLSLQIHKIAGLQ